MVLKTLKVAPSITDLDDENNLPDTVFDNLAEFYNNSPNLPYRKHLEIPTIKKILGNITGLSLLDYGCGPGALSQQFKMMGAKHVIGYDTSKGMLHFARQKEKECTLDITYLSNLTSDYSQYFDIVIAIYTISFVNHYNELQAMINQMSSLLKPKGKIIIVVANPNFSDDPEYYRPYGIRLKDAAPRSDGSIIDFNICYSNYDVTFPAYNWTIETLNKLLEQSEFHNISLNELISPPSEYIDELADYISHPHIKIITANKIEA